MSNNGLSNMYVALTFSDTVLIIYIFKFNNYITCKAKIIFMIYE